MPLFAANLSLLFTDRPFLDRFAAAARAGFRAVECQFPYDWPAAEIAQRLHAHGLQMVLHNLPAGDWAAGDRGIACHPDRVAEFRQGVPQALACARALGVPRLNCLAGLLPAGVDPAQAQATLVDNLRFAAQALAEHGLTLLVEPINTRDLPGFFLSRTDAALALIEAVGAPNLKLQYDIYHAQRMEGELAATLQRCLPHLGHVQLADNPGRHEPGTGEIHFGFLLRWLDQIGYSGHVGCEYHPAQAGPGGTEAGLGWLQAFR
ncbi:hydroxypyruvate isomerase [Aquabacterium sp. A08]|uniref:hydroxypyruvate isomerase n=1 Tax=Aquabacterium sp. A08 TaxID=2718532 RepID=UPI001423CACE|nr:hydroxypyruvate isomerase [Aquabacterium sp. A08]NIC42013.1 hydroxypyruvate isomerase [Aquabacterium sp. A08]NIC42018.1 hydroxypyruvate isomerase [Aquabacterium sp. A08]